MPLPKIATPTYELELPSTKETVEYRPFLYLQYGTDFRMQLGKNGIVFLYYGYNRFTQYFCRKFASASSPSSVM